MRDPKNAQKTGIIIASTPNTSCFAIEMEDFRDEHGYRQASRAKARLHPEKPREYTLTRLQLTHYVGPPPRRDQKSKRM